MEEFRRWMAMAKSDVESAEDNYGIKRYYVAAQLAHQAAEKALKALLIKKTGSSARVHDLVFLGKHVAMKGALLGKCADLSAIYIEAKYGVTGGGTPEDKFKIGNTQEYVDIAKEIIKWAENQI